MADDIIPEKRAPKPARERDFTAEYARRDQIARTEGFKNYWHKRKATSARRRREQGGQFRQFAA